MRRTSPGLAVRAKPRSNLSRGAAAPARPPGRHLAAAALAAAGLCASGLGLVGAGAAGAQAPPPAFFTWQAPGGTSTSGSRVVALTFDDGPGPFTPQVLSVLEAYHVPATFFEIGENVARYPQDTRLVAHAGYPVEDHTWSHPDLATLPASAIGSQIDRTQAEIRSVIGQTPSCVRPPDDAWNDTVLEQVGERGLTTMSYSVDPRDWALPGVTAIVRSVLGAAFPGAVVDLHDGGGDRSQTVAALPRIITGLEAAGYRLVPICGYLAQRHKSVLAAFGQAPAEGPSVVSNAPLVGAAPSAPSGLWLVASDGGVFSFGAPFFGSMGGRHLNAPIVGMAAPPTRRGYWLVARDGGIFSFGTAGFHGSTGGTHLNASIVGMAADPATGGYWLVASDGGVFSFGAPFFGSMGGRTAGARFFALVVTGGGAGYWVAGDTILAA